MRATSAEVAIVQRVLPHYRLPFFARLHEVLASESIHLKVIYGQEVPGTVPSTVDLNREWASRITNRYLRIGHTELVWQPCLEQVRDASLVIVEQANRLVVNYALLVERALRRGRLAYWGHGRNFQSAGGAGLRERLKRSLIGRADWWFAYTQRSAESIIGAGVSPDRVTVVENAIDNDALRVAIANVSEIALQRARADLGIGRTDRVALYCGGMHAGKELEFLLDACRRIRTRIPTFHAVFVGDGPSADIVRAAALHNPWIHAVGPRFGADRAVYFALAELMMMPAEVGLAVVDSFVAERPMFTTDTSTHGPELSYLEHGTNGIVAPFVVAHYADAVCEYLENPALLAKLREGCAAAAARYTLSNMVNRFAAGIERCLHQQERS